MKYINIRFAISIFIIICFPNFIIAIDNQKILNQLPSLNDVKNPHKKIDKQLKKIHSWNFDVFSLNKKLPKGTLKYLVFEIFRRLKFFENLNINEQILSNFCDEMEFYSLDNKYNPYHNSIHAAEVTQSLFSLIDTYKLQIVFNDLELFSLILSSVIHDYKHPGLPNAIQKSSNTLIYREVTKMYPYEQSYNERYSFIKFLGLINEDACNLLINFNKDEKKEILSIIESVVLSTDLASYHKNNQMLDNVIKNVQINYKNYRKYRADIFSAMLRTSDISSTVKNWAIHKQWHSRLEEESIVTSFNQKLLNHERNVADEQISFINMFVKPTIKLTYKVLKKVRPFSTVYESNFLKENLYLNLYNWEEKSKKHMKKDEKYLTNRKKYFMSFLKNYTE